jgi:hypothetical protein
MEAIRHKYSTWVEIAVYDMPRFNREIKTLPVVERKRIKHEVALRLVVIASKW